MSISTPTWSWTDPEVYALIVYSFAAIYSVWKQIQRSRLEFETELQLQKFKQPIPQTLLWFTRLVSLCFILRIGWLLLRVTELAPREGSVATDEQGCLSGWKCATQVFISALNRFASFMHIVAFSLIVLFWVRWRNTAGPQTDKLQQQDELEQSHSRSSTKFAPSGTSVWDIGFLMIDVWLFLFQAAILPIALIFDLGTTADHVYDAYVYTVAAASFFIAISLIYNGWKTYHLVLTQYRLYKHWRRHVDQIRLQSEARLRRPNLHLTSTSCSVSPYSRYTNLSSISPSSYTPSPKRSPGSLFSDAVSGTVSSNKRDAEGLSSPGWTHTRMSSDPGGTFESRDHKQMPHSVSVNEQQSDSYVSNQRQHHDSYVSNQKQHHESYSHDMMESGKVSSLDTTQRNMRWHTARARRKAAEVNSTHVVGAQLKRSLWKIVVMVLICASLFILRGIVYIWAPATGGEITISSQVLHPWLYYVIPEVLTSLLALALVTPHSTKEMLWICLTCQCWGMAKQWFRWIAKDVIFCVSCCGCCGILERRIFMRGVGRYAGRRRGSYDTGTGVYAFDSLDTLKAAAGARGIPLRYFELSPETQAQLYLNDCDAESCQMIPMNAEDWRNIWTSSSEQVPKSNFCSFDTTENICGNAKSVDEGEQFIYSSRWQSGPRTPLLADDSEQHRQSFKHSIFNHSEPITNFAVNPVSRSKFNYRSG